MARVLLWWKALLAASLILVACGRPPVDPPLAPNPTAIQSVAAPADDGTPVSEAQAGEENMAFELASPAFAAGGEIPRRHSCDGEDVSPPLQWSEPPAGTASLALIMDDPDAPAGTWDHWILFNLPADAAGLAEGVEGQEQRPDGSRHGTNSWGRTSYGGPCPPAGTHRYFFRLYALDQELALSPGANKAAVLQAMEGHILAQAELMGTYRR